MKKKFFVGLTAGLFSVSTLISGTAMAGTDTKAPEILKSNVAPVIVSDSNFETNVLFELHVKDDISGFKQGRITLVSPSGEQKQSINFKACDRVNGDANDGLYKIEMELPQYVESGTWHIDNIFLKDNASNSRYITAEKVGVYSPKEEVEVSFYKNRALKAIPAAGNK